MQIFPTMAGKQIMWYTNESSANGQTLYLSVSIRRLLTRAQKSKNIWTKEQTPKTKKVIGYLLKEKPCVFAPSTFHPARESLGNYFADS